MQALQYVYTCQYNLSPYDWYTHFVTKSHLKEDKSLQMASPEGAVLHSDLEVPLRSLKFVLCLVIVQVMSMVSAGAPGDAEPFCTNELPSNSTIPAPPAPVHPPTSKILLDSYNYINLLPPQDGAVWQAVDNDNNNEAGRGTEVRVCTS